MNHLSLLLHCLSTKDEATRPLVNNSLYISIQDIETYIQALIRKGYSFCLPSESHRYTNPTVSFSFDDGQSNNRFFIPLSQKYNIPFILFVSSYYVKNQLPFPWDQQLTPKTNLLEYPAHKPFSENELREAMVCENLYLAPHGYTHRPFLKVSSDEMEKEIKQDLDFLSSFPRVLTHDFAFPNGHYNRKTLKWAQHHFKRVYTIEGAKGSTKHLINRVSLINPSFGGDFDKQIKRTQSLRFKLARQYVHLKARF